MAQKLTTKQNSNVSKITPLTTFNELCELAVTRELDVMLGKALRLGIKFLNAEAGSILFQAQTTRNIRSGAFRPEALARIKRWEEIIKQRIQQTSWNISTPTAIPISTITLPTSHMTLINLPLLRNIQVVGAFSFVLPPDSTFTPAKEEGLLLLARGVGQMASLIADLDQSHHQVKQLRVFYELGQALATTFDIKRLLAETMELAASVIDAGAASILLIDEQEEELVFEVSHGTRGQLLRQQRIPVDEGIAGWVIQNGRAVIANDARSDQRFSHRVDVRTGFLTQSIAAVPLRIKGRIIGVLEVLNKYSDAGFSDEDIQLMSSIATQAAIAVENARLYQQIRQERDHIVEAQEEIRRELAHNLHDGPLQHLSAINMSLDHLRRLSVKGNPEAVQTQIEALQTLAHQTARDARNLLFELRPLILETDGLMAAFEQYVTQLRNTERFNIRLKTIEEIDRYPTKTAGTIFAIVQEAIDNVKRHANADHIWLLIEAQDEHISVTIRDDGQGFEVGIIDDPYDRHACFGLLNMRERATLIGAELTIESRSEPPNRGTTVQLILPQPREVTH